MLAGEKVMLPPNKDNRTVKQTKSETIGIYNGMFESERLAQGFIYSVVLGKPQAKIRGRW